LEKLDKTNKNLQKICQKAWKNLEAAPLFHVKHNVNTAGPSGLKARCEKVATGFSQKTREI
jgi:hypothetical protein